MPIILGGIATMGYVINFNNRGYERFRLAYDQVAAGKPDEFNGRYAADYLRRRKTITAATATFASSSPPDFTC